MANRAGGPDAARSMADIDRFLAWRLVRTGRAVERALTATFAEYDLTPTQFGVLTLLAAEVDHTQSDLARAVLVRPQSVGPLITSLADRGLITRRGPVGRGRRSYFDLTDAGRGILTAVEPAVLARYAPDRLGLDEVDARALDRLLSVAESSVAAPDP